MANQKVKCVWYIKNFVFFIICTLYKLDSGCTLCSVGGAVQSDQSTLHSKNLLYAWEF